MGGPGGGLPFACRYFKSQPILIVSQSLVSKHMLSVANPAIIPLAIGCDKASLSTRVVSGRSFDEIIQGDYCQYFQYVARFIGADLLRDPTDFADRRM